MDGYVTTIITSRLSTVTAYSAEYIIDQALDFFGCHKPSLEEEDNCVGVPYKMHFESKRWKGHIILLCGISQ